MAQVAQLELELEENRVAQDIFVVNLHVLTAMTVMNPFWNQWTFSAHLLVMCYCALAGATPEIIS